MEREFVAKIDGRGVDDDAGSILIYRLGGQVSLAVGVLFGKSPKYRPKRVDLFGV
jgi:hypothetical protein